MGVVLSLTQQQGIAIGVLAVCVVGLSAAVVALWKTNKRESRQHYSDLLDVVRRSAELEAKLLTTLDVLVQRKGA